MTAKYKGNKAIVEAGEKYLMGTYKRLPISIERGEGARIYDADGNEYLDFVGGVAVNSLGHCHPAVVEALKERMETVLHCSNYYYNEPAVHLAELICENSCMEKVFFGNSGAEANEGAIKLARKYQKMKGHPEKYVVLTMKNSFHGRTIATLTATGQEKVQHGFEPLPVGFDYIEFNNVESVEPAVAGRTDVAAIMVEPVQGEGGVLPATKEFLEELRRVCDKYELLLIFDEVQVGAGRTGKLFAYQNFGVEPDVMTLAKALSSGVPIGAVTARGEAAEALKPGEHGTTFGGNPLACAVGVATIETMVNGGVLENCEKIGNYLREKMQTLVDKYDSVTGVRGMGLINGLLCTKPGAEVVEKCFEKGVLINCTANTVLRFIPPLTITEADVDKLVATLDEVFTEINF